MRLIKNKYSSTLLGVSVAVMGLMGIQNIRADVVMQETFDYSTGNLNSATTGGIWTKQVKSGTEVQVVNGNLSYPGRPVPTGKMVQWGGAINQPNARTDYAAVTTGSLYASFIYRADNLTGLTTTGKALVGFRNTSTSQSNANINMRLASGDPTKYNLGIEERGAAVVWDAQNYAVGDTHLLAFSWNIIPGANNDSARLWVDPASDTFGAGSDPIGFIQSSGGIDGTQVNRFRIRQDSLVGRPTLQSLDELVIGTTWADVTPIQAVPEPSTLALLGVGLAALIARRKFRV